MDAVKMTKTLTQPIPELPELNDFIGAEVEIIVLVNRSNGIPSVRKAGLGRGHVELKPGWDDPIDDFKDYV